MGTLAGALLTYADQPVMGLDGSPFNAARYQTRPRRANLFADPQAAPQPSMMGLAPKVGVDSYDLTGGNEMFHPQAQMQAPNTLGLNGQAAYEEPQAIRSNQPSPAMMRLIQATPEEQAYRTMLSQGASKHTGGIGSRIKDAFKGMALAAAQAPDGREGLALLGGGLAGAINPQYTHNLEYRGQLPLAAQRAAASRALADGELERRMGYAKTFGTDSESGAPTMALLNAQAMQNYRNAGLDLREALGMGRLGIQQQSVDERGRHNVVSEGQAVTNEQGRTDRFNRGLTQRADQFNQTQALRTRAQQFREWIGNQNLGLRREYNQILRQKGENHPDVEAFRQMVEQGLVDEQGMADNPKYDLEGTKATFKGMGYSDEEATQAAQAYLNRKGIAPKIPVTKLPQYQGAKVASKARGGKQTTATVPRIFPRSLIHDYAVENKMTDADAEAHIKQNGYQIQ